MKLLTHTAFGLFLGTLFYYFSGFDFSFIFLTGFAAFLPDIDWRMQYSWGFGNVHRKLLHNIWFLSILVIATYLLFWSLTLVLGIIIGFVSHLLSDSFTVKGVYWLYPIGKESEKHHLKGSFSMSETKATKVEEYLQIIFFALSGFLFLIKQTPLENIFSIEGLMTIAIIFGVGFYLYKTLGKTIKRIIRRLGL
jgi:hypothetical protein